MWVWCEGFQINPRSSLLSFISNSQTDQVSTFVDPVNLWIRNPCFRNLINLNTVKAFYCSVAINILNLAKVDISTGCLYVFLSEGVMAELPSGLLEACVVVGASGDKLRDVHQVRICSYAHYNMAPLLKVEINHNFFVCGQITTEFTDFIWASGVCPEAIA